MGSKRLFLRWSLVAMLFALATATLFVLGYFAKLNELDQSHLSFAIIVLFWVTTLYCGKLVWKTDICLENIPSIDSVPETSRQQLSRITHQADHVWFAAWVVCPTLGLLGTIIGLLIVMLSGFENLNSTDPSAIKNLLASLGSGVATALLTTLVGLVCSLLLSVQDHFLVHKIGEYLAGDKK